MTHSLLRKQRWSIARGNRRWWALERGRRTVSMKTTNKREPDEPHPPFSLVRLLVMDTPTFLFRDFVDTDWRFRSFHYFNNFAGLYSIIVVIDDLFKRWWFSSRSTSKRKCKIYPSGGSGGHCSSHWNSRSTLAMGSCSVAFLGGSSSILSDRLGERQSSSKT